MESTEIKIRILGRIATGSEDQDILADLVSEIASKRRRAEVEVAHQWKGRDLVQLVTINLSPDN